MQTLIERGCGLDVHQATVVACILIVRKDGKVQKQVRTFGTTTRELLSLREWMLSQGRTHVAMESTGIYWKPVFAILEGGGLEIVVANAQHVKKVPRRKTDVKDPEWIADLLCHGLLRSSFVPSQPGARAARLDPLPTLARGKPIGRAQPFAEAVGDCEYQTGQCGQRRLRSLRPTDVACSGGRQSHPARNGRIGQDEAA